jgi:hypothetical protein
MASSVRNDSALHNLRPAPGHRISPDPDGYAISDGIEAWLVSPFLRQLSENPVIGKEVMHRYFTEEFSWLARILEQDSR